MNGIDPVVRLMLLCEDVRRDPHKPNKLDILGLINSVEAVGEPPFPVGLPVLCVYLSVTGGRGTGQARIECRHADSGQVVFSGPTHTLSFPPDPLAVRSLVFRMRECLLPSPALYVVQFWYNGKPLAEQPLIVRLPRHE